MIPLVLRFNKSTLFFFLPSLLNHTFSPVSRLACWLNGMSYTVLEPVLLYQKKKEKKKRCLSGWNGKDEVIEATRKWVTESETVRYYTYYREADEIGLVFVQRGRQLTWAWCEETRSFRIIPLNIDSVFTFGQVRHWMLCVCKIEEVHTYMQSHCLITVF